MEILVKLINIEVNDGKRQCVETLSGRVYEVFGALPAKGYASPKDWHTMEAELVEEDGKRIFRQRQRTKEGIQATLKEKDSPLVKPDQTVQINPKTGEKISKLKPDVPRLDLALKALEQLGIKSVEIQRGIPLKRSYRQAPYWMIIPEDGENQSVMNKLILGCDAPGNRTFVIQDRDPETVWGLTKEELKKLKCTTHFIWFANNEWTQTLCAQLTRDIPEEDDSLINYFNSKANIDHDFQAFLNQIGNTVEPVEIKVNDIYKNTIICSNGKRLSGGQYLSRMAIAFGWCTNSTEAGSFRRKALERFKALTSCVEILDSDYFQNPQKVKKDLDQFVEKYNASEFKKKGPPVKKRVDRMSLEKLQATDIDFIEIQCQNRETLKGSTYLCRAAIGLGIAENNKEGYLKKHKALQELKKICGIKTREKIKKEKQLEKEYFENPENMDFDFQAFLNQLGDVTPSKITAEDILKKEIICKKGYKISGRLYLHQVAIAFNWATNNVEAANFRKKALLKFKSLTEKSKMLNETYFKNASNVEADLQAFLENYNANEFEKEEEVQANPTAPITLEELCFTHLTFIRIQCQNGESIKGMPYLCRAAIALGLAKNIQEGYGKKSDAFNSLKKMVLNHQSTDTEATPPGLPG